MNNIKFEINQNIATITFDLENEKVNKLSFEVLKEFDEKLNLVQENEQIKALVIDSAKKEVATEFDIQGLELDWTCVCWDSDLYIDNNEWNFRKFKGTKWYEFSRSSKNNQ